MSDKELVDERQSRRPERHGHGDKPNGWGPLDEKPIRYRRKRNDTAQEEFGERAGRNESRVELPRLCAQTNTDGEQPHQRSSRGQQQSRPQSIGDRSEEW